MRDVFTRSKNNPVIKPDPKNPWESLKVYNPGAVFHNEKYHLFYRAMGKDGVCRLGYAVSEDGENFERYSEPVMEPKTEYEKWGIEDPRISKISDTFYMIYTGFDGVTPRLHIATSKDLKNWEKHGLVFKDFNFIEEGGVFVEWKNGKPIETTDLKPGREEWSKAGAIFPEKIKKKYWMVFNEFRIFYATSDNGKDWNVLKDKYLVESRKNSKKGKEYFDNVFVEAGPPPIKTDKGWLVFYHGINDAIQYHLGFVLTDLNDPTKILYRSEEPLFGPKEGHELSGMVDIIPGMPELLREGEEKKIKEKLKEAEKEGFMPQVTFTPAAVKNKGEIRIFYGAGDQAVCTATALLKDILSEVPENL